LERLREHTIVESFVHIAKDEFGKQYLKDKVAKLIINVEHNEKFAVSYTVANKECVVKIEAPIGCKNVTDSGKAAALIEAQLTPDNNIPLSFLREKKSIQDSPEWKKLMDRAAKLGIAYDVDWEGISKIPGQSVHYVQKHELPASTAFAAYVWRSGSGIAVEAVGVLEAILKDDLGKGAFKAKFDKVITSVGPSDDKFETKLVANGKTLTFHTIAKLPTTSSLNTKVLTAELEKML